MKKGPIDGFAWPDKLTARRVSLDTAPRLCGYDLRGDLAAHYTPSTLLYLGLTGELPTTAARGRAFDTALMWWAPVTIAEAPAHAASLAMLARASTSAVLGTGAVALAEQVRDLLDRHAAVLEWLSAPNATAFPSTHCARDEEERAAVAQLATQIEVDVDVLTKDPTLDAALLGVLFELGLTARAQIEAVILWARLPCVWAEALAVDPTRFRSYPMDVPHFEYEGADDID